MFDDCWSRDEPGWEAWAPRSRPAAPPAPLGQHLHGAILGLASAGGWVAGKLSEKQLESLAFGLDWCEVLCSRNQVLVP